MRVLGTPALRVAGRDLPFPSGRPGRLVADLLLAGGRVLTPERLIDDVWGEELPAEARSALHTTVRRARRALGSAGGRLVHEEAGYRLDLTGVDVDADVFAGRVREARSRRDLAAYDEALAAWTGPPWQPWAGDLAQGEALRLQELHVVAREERAALLLEHGRVDDAVADLRRMVAEAPLRDRTVGLLMEALHRLGSAADALAVFSRHRESLAEELGLDPSPELVEVQRRVLVREQVPGPTQPTPEPAPAPDEAPTIFGRETELRDLAAALRRHRVVSVVGPGGVGKTSVARGIAPDGGSTWWVDLAPVTTEAGVRAVTATALGVEVFPGGTPEAALRRRLSAARGLLVLDSCEHVIGSVADLVAEVVAQGAGVRVLATSRERLGLEDEHVFWLSPLELPSAAPDPGDGLVATPSVALFLARARAASPDLVVDDVAVREVGALVRALDGLPLAIELAASRVGVVDPTTLRRRLEARIDIVRGHRRRRGPARHQTLTATIEWSYELLDPEEQRAFRRLAWFVGPFTLEDAEALLGEGDAIELVLGLVERSLVVRPDAAGEYRLLDTLRAFARDRASPPEAAESQAVHSAWATALADQVAAGMRSAQEARWEAVATRRLPELAAAVRRSLGGDDPTTAGRIVTALHDWAYYRVRPDVLAWAREVADRPGTDPSPGVLAAASSHAWMLGRTDAAVDYAQRGIAAAGGADRPEALACLGSAGDAALAVGDLERVLEISTLGYRLATAAGEPWHRVMAATGLVLSQVYRGRPATEELALLRTARSSAPCPTALSMALYTEAEALALTEPAQALQLLARAREMAQSSGSRLAAGVSLVAETALRGRVGALDTDTVEQTVAAIEHWSGSGNDTVFVTCLRNVVTLLDRFDAHRAVVTLAAALEAHTAGRPSYGEEKQRLEAALQRAHDQLTSQAADAARRDGTSLTLEQAAEITVAELRRRVSGSR